MKHLFRPFSYLTSSTTFVTLITGRKSELSMSFYKFVILFLFPVFVFSIDYDVAISGVKNRELSTLIKDNSDLFKLQNRPPFSLNALSYRAKNDIPQIIKMLRSQGFYDATASFSIEEKKRTIVNLRIVLGPRYILESYNIHQDAFEINCQSRRCTSINVCTLGINLNQPISWEEIIDAELSILDRLAECGYPLATVEKRDVSVDMLTKSIAVSEWIKNGPQSRYGPISIIGLNSIKPEFILKKILWEEGDLYSSFDIEKTQQKLIQTELFSSVLITHTEGLDQEGQLPLKIHVEEARHKSFDIGVTYATIDGFGFTVGWINRNLRGLGERLKVVADVSQRAHVGMISYTKPDVWIRDQDFSAEVSALREKIVPYLAFTYRGGLRLDRQHNQYFYTSVGIKGEYIIIKDSINNGKFTLIGTPVFLRYSTADSILNPTKGITTMYKITPYFEVQNPNDFFLKQTLITNFYFPTLKERLIFAFRTQFGSIAFAPLSSIPFNKRFLGGSDDDLRGYRYKTVSPTNKEGDPLGGRSVIYFTFEPRIRITETIGIVPFTDWGTVSENEYPDPTEKWFKSIGIGLRYYTFFGPIRLDVAFPLNDRRIDPDLLRVYISIGQTF